MSRATCLRCDRPARTRGHCEKHYRYLLQTGRFTDQLTDATDAYQHLRQLRELHWTLDAIADASGLTTGHVGELVRGEYRRVRASTARRILSVPLEPSGWHRGINPVGTQRRIHALAWMGWPAKVIADRVGVKTATIYTVSFRGGGRGRVSSRLARDIAAVYEELSGHWGPSQQTATKAKARGWAPPLAWDAETIDDPRARSRGARRSA